MNSSQQILFAGDTFGNSEEAHNTPHKYMSETSNHHPKISKLSPFYRITSDSKQYFKNKNNNHHQIEHNPNWANIRKTRYVKGSKGSNRFITSPNKENSVASINQVNPPNKINFPSKSGFRRLSYHLPQRKMGTAKFGS